MREPTFYVLAALLRGPLHGYAIMKRAEELSGGRVRRTYGLTESGSAALRAEAVRMAEAAELVIGRARETKAGPLTRKLRTT